LIIIIKNIGKRDRVTGLKQAKRMAAGYNAHIESAMGAKV
jgi:hypothetical protein